MLDVDAAKVYLAAADTNLKADKLEQAERDLMRVQQDVMVSSVDTDVPLVTARVDLFQAQRAIQNDNAPVATANLASAYDALARYHSMLITDSQRAKEALNVNLAETLKTQKDATITQVDGWWHELRHWMD
jgi:hypothetical protein